MGVVSVVVGHMFCVEIEIILLYLMSAMDFGVSYNIKWKFAVSKMCNQFDFE